MGAADGPWTLKHRCFWTRRSAVPWRSQVAARSMPGPLSQPSPAGPGRTQTLAARGDSRSRKACLSQHWPPRGTTEAALSGRQGRGCRAALGSPVHAHPTLPTPVPSSPGPAPGPQTPHTRTLEPTWAQPPLWPLLQRLRPQRAERRRDTAAAPRATLLCVEGLEGENQGQASHDAEGGSLEGQPCRARGAPADRAGLRPTRRPPRGSQVGHPAQHSSLFRPGTRKV